VKLSSEVYPFEDAKGYWEFTGISMLVPVNVRFEDGVELVWYHCGYQSQSKIKSIVKSKAKLLARVKGPVSRVPVAPPTWAE
jgi:hypothetical protein